MNEGKEYLKVGDERLSGAVKNLLFDLAAFSENRLTSSKK